MIRVLALAALLAAPTALAQPAFDVGRLDQLFDRPPSVEVNLRGSLLRLAAAATAEDDPEVAAMIRSLDAVTVRIYSLAAARPGFVQSLDGVVTGLETDDWYPMVRVRSDPDAMAQYVGADRPDASDEPDGLEDVWVMVRDLDDAFGGLAVLAVDNWEQTATFVHIDGRIDVEQIGRLSAQFGGLDLDLGEDADSADSDD